MVHVRAELNGAESVRLELEIRVLNSSTPATANADIDDGEHAEDHAREQQLKKLKDSSVVAPAFSSDESANFPASGKQLTGRGNARQIAGVKRLTNSSLTDNNTSLMLAADAAVGNMSSSTDTVTGIDDMLSTTTNMLAGVLGAGGVAAAAVAAANYFCSSWHHVSICFLVMQN